MENDIQMNVILMKNKYTDLLTCVKLQNWILFNMSEHDNGLRVS